MRKRRLGKSSLEVAPIVFGGNVFGWTVDQPTAFELLDAFVGAGFNAIDTADSYSRWIPGNKGGESETMIGNWLAQGGGRRERVLIMTKLGSDMGGDRKGLSRKYIVWSIEESLKRLKTDYVDLYQSHRDDPNTPIQETLEAYAALIKAGKVRAIGASNFTRARIQESLDVARKHGLPRYESLQPKYNMYDRAEFEKEHMDFCVKENIGVIPYYALANGFLTGKYRGPKDFGQSQRGGRMGDYLNERGKRILAALDAVSKTHDVKPAAVALAWLMARPSITAPIASATRLEQLDDFVAAANLKLSPADMEKLNAASAE